MQSSVRRAAAGLSGRASAAADRLADDVKAVHRQFPTGVTVVSTAVDGKPYGLAVNAVSSVSLDPPLVLVCVAERASTYPHLLACEHFAINYLACGQEAIAERFARSGGDKFADVRWSPGGHGSPLVADVAAFLEVRVATRLPAYTHTIFVGHVVDAGAYDRAPLLYYAGELHHLPPA